VYRAEQLRGRCLVADKACASQAGRQDADCIIFFHMTFAFAGFAVSLAISPVNFGS
jgi:hypothetical protein